MNPARIPDGTRELLVAHPEKVGAEARKAGKPLDCWTLTVSAKQQAEPPAECARIIEPGRWYLHRQILKTRSVAICAGCAVVRAGKQFGCTEKTT